MKKPTHAERLARAAEDELPYAAQSGLTTSLIAGAQPQNAMVDRRIYQPSLASMEAQNPDPRLGRPGFINALQDVYADPGRMLPGSGGWTEGVGAAAPHLGAAALDLVNPAGFAGRAGSMGKRVVAESGNVASQMRLPSVQQVAPRVPPRGQINPQFAPTGMAPGLIARGFTPPPVNTGIARSLLGDFVKAIAAGDKDKMNWVSRRIDAAADNHAFYSPEQMKDIDAIHTYMSDVMNNKVKTTRHGPYGATRSSNSNAPALSRGEQPDPFAPTIGREGPLYDPEGFMRKYE